MNGSKQEIHILFRVSQLTQGTSDCRMCVLRHGNILLVADWRRQRAEIMDHRRRPGCSRGSRSPSRVSVRRYEYVQHSKRIRLCTVRLRLCQAYSNMLTSFAVPIHHGDLYHEHATLQPSMSSKPIAPTDDTAHHLRQLCVLSAGLERHIATAWTKFIFGTMLTYVCGVLAGMPMQSKERKCQM